MDIKAVIGNIFDLQTGLGDTRLGTVKIIFFDSTSDQIQGQADIDVSVSEFKNTTTFKNNLNTKVIAYAATQGWTIVANDIISLL